MYYCRIPYHPQTFNNGSISPSKRRHHVLAGGTQPGDSDLSDDDLSDEVDGVSREGRRKRRRRGGRERETMRRWSYYRVSSGVS